MNNIKYLDGIYNASLQIFKCSDKIKKPGIFASRKKKEEFNRKYTKSGTVQIGMINSLYILKFTSQYNEELLINLTEAKKCLSEETRLNKCTNLESEKLNCYWLGQDIDCEINLRVYSKSFGKRLRRLGFNVIIDDMNTDDTDTDDVDTD